LILYVDDALISGSKELVQQIETKLKTFFDCNFAPPKGFLGLDVHHDEPSNIRLSMKTYTNKFKDTFNIPDTHPILTPGRTDRKIIRGEHAVVDTTYRSTVGSLMWATMGIRYDIVYTVKELSRVLQEPTAIAQEILTRTLTYLTQTADAYLEYNHTAMHNFTLPPTCKKPGQQPTHYEVNDYNPDDSLPHHDDQDTPQTYTYIGKQCIITCYTDIDLAG
jgi:hypothetical protein